VGASIHQTHGGIVTRSLKWLGVVISTALAFGISLWASRAASFSWMPHADADRWVVDAAFATVIAAAVGGAGSWWAGREKDTEDHDEPDVSQLAKASGHASITQIGRDQITTRGRRDDNPR
jgi:nitrogen fixation-related uncharacterized protein